MKKYISPFVSKMNALKMKLTPRMLWFSKPDTKLAGTTYIKKNHGELK